MKKLFLLILVFGLTGIVFITSVWAQKRSLPSSQKSFQTGGWQYVGSGGFSTGRTWDLSLAFHPSGQPWVAFEDWGPPAAMRVMRFDGSSWADAGQINDSISGEWLGLDFDASGTPMTGFRHPGPHSSMFGFATVIQYNGSSWSYTGNPWFSAGDVYHTSMAVSPGGIPHIVYQDASYDNSGTVMKFDGSAWVNVGTPGFTQSFARNPVIAFSPSGNPYIAFSEGSSTVALKASVMKFNGTSWEFVGIEGFSAGEVDSISLAFNSAGEPFVAFSDEANSWKATVMRFDGTSWVNVGNPGFSDGPAGWTSIGFSQGGKAVVAFQDGGNGYKASAMIFDGNAWSYLGMPGFSADSAACIRLRFSLTGQPYVAFTDFGDGGKVTVMMYDGPLGTLEIQRPGLSVYPDPVQNFLNINTEIPGSSQYKVEILNFLGSTIISGKYSSRKLQMNVESLSAGIYFVKISCQGVLYSSRFIKK